MNFRLTAVLFGSIFVVGLALLIVSFTGGGKPPTDTILEELAGAKADQIDTVEFDREGGGKLKLVRDRAAKDKDRWDVVEPFKARADSGAVGEVVSALLKAKPAPFAQMPNLTNAKLQPAGLRVTLRQGDRASTVSLGDVTLGGKGVVFVTTSARPSRPMAVPRAALEPLFREANKSGLAADLAKGAGDFRSKTVFEAARGAGDDVIGVTLRARGKTLSLVQSPRGWKFVEPSGWGDADPAGDAAAAPGTFTGVRPLLGALTSLQALSAADFVESPTPQDLEKYGLNPNNPDRVEVRLTNKDKVETVAFVGKKEAAAPAPPAGPHGMTPPPASKWWVQVQGQPGVVRANAGDLSGLVSVVENPDPLRDRNLLTAEKARIDGLDLAGGAVKLRKLGGALGAWKLYGNPAAGDPQVASLTEVERVVNALTERRTVRSFPAGNEANFGPGAVTVKVWADGFEAADPKGDAKADPRAEPKEKGKPTTLVFGKVEGELVNVKRTLPEGQTDFFLLPVKVKVGAGGEVVDVLRAANEPRVDFLDKSLKSFASTAAAKLTVQGAANFDLDRDDKADEASAKGPVFRFAADARGAAGQQYKKGEQADVQVVQDLLDILATTQSVTRFVDEAPAPEKLAEYGLGTATKLRVTVGLKAEGDDKERVYEFGKETADPNFVYVQQRGRPAVFTLPKFIPDKFTSADLRNRAIFKVNPAEVARVEIVGWGDKLGAPSDLVLEKNKEGTWVAVKAPTPGYVADPAKVNAFVAALGTLQVRSYTGDAAMDPRHGLGDPKQVFVVTLANAAGGHHLHLRLGGPADPNGTTLYAFTGRVPDGKPIVTVDAAPFKAYKDGPAAFSR
ncbi:DUF4340 domain-containing protein [Gemmata sp.]|uniref:DUF4340 domain-containing protein n=1 Tax=Gemmata sp. TaxID=1914242 RepID=UPI003F70E369